MKRFLNTLLAAVVALGMVSCAEDYETVMDPSELYIIDYGTVHLSSNDFNNYYIIRDDGIALLVIRDQAYTSEPGMIIADGSRVLINYNVMSDLSPFQLPESCKAGYAIQLNALLTIPCQQVSVGEPQVECSPVLVTSIHVGSSYLDLCFDYKSLNNKRHDFELYCPEPDQSPLELYLVHHGDEDKADNGAMLSAHRISFNIEALRGDAARQFTLHWVDLTGEAKSRTGALKAR